MKILYVCLGNICRSPALHQLMQKRIDEEDLSNKIQVDSCGVDHWHVGEDADHRMRLSAKNRGKEFGPHIAKAFHPRFFIIFDYIFVVTEEVFDIVRNAAEKAQDEKKIVLATHFSKSYKDQEVPDPYYGGQSHFDEVFTMIETIVEETLVELKSQLA